MDEQALKEALFHCAVDCYVDALAAVEEHVFRSFAEKTADAPRSIEALRREVLFNPVRMTMEAARDQLASGLEETSRQMRQRLAGSVEMTELLALLSEAARSIQRHNARNESRMTQLGRGLDEAILVEDVNAFRCRVRVEISRLQSAIEEMRSENAGILSDLDREMASYRSRLDDAERRANIDTLTGLPNRRLFHAHIDQFVQSGEPFSLLMLDLNYFKSVNDSYGHLAGDQILQSFAERLEQALRKDDLAARWGGDEFIVILPGNLRSAMDRARHFEACLNGHYQIEVHGAPIRIRVTAAMGIAEHRHSESAEQTLARADAVLYAAKTGAR